MTNRVLTCASALALAVGLTLTSRVSAQPLPGTVPTAVPTPPLSGTATTTVTVSNPGALTAATTPEDMAASALPPPVPPPVTIVAEPTAQSEPGTSVVRYHDFMDTRLTWTFGDDDVLQPTGYRYPVSPLPGIGDRTQYQLFFDALNSRFAGRENLTHLVMYARAPGFIPRIVTEASLVVRLDLTQLITGNANLNQSLYDAGTFLRVLYQTNPTGRPQDGLSFTFFPFDTDRFRLGYLWDLSWGGNAAFPARIGGAPGFKASLDIGPFSAFVGFKTAQIVVPLQVVNQSMDIEVVRVQETNYAALGGFGVAISDMFRIDAGGGFFQQGRFDFPGIRGEPVYMFGGSARAVLHHNLAPQTSIDMLLYRNHPDFPMQFFAPEVYTPGQISWMVSLEATVMDQHLADISTPGATTFQPGAAGALQGRVKIGYLGLTATGLYRDVPFLLQNVPSFVPYQSLPSGPGVSVTPEIFGAVSVDYRVTALNLTPSFIFGLQMPATFGTEVSEGALSSQRTLVIRQAGNFSILPPGHGASIIVSSRLAARWDLSSIFAIVGWLQYVRDGNGTLLDVDQSGTRQVRYFQAPDQFGFGITAQARY